MIAFLGSCATPVLLHIIQLDCIKVQKCISTKETGFLISKLEILCHGIHSDIRGLWAHSKNLNMSSISGSLDKKLPEKPLKSTPEKKGKKVAES